MAIPQFHQKQWMSQETPSKKKEEEERIQKKSLKKTTLTQMVGEVNLKQTDWKAEIVVHHPRQNSWRINSLAIVQKKPVTQFRLYLCPHARNNKRLWCYSIHRSLK